MSYTMKKTEAGTTELTVTVPPAEYQKQLDRAMKRISDRAAMKGFRPGKVPLDILKREVTDMAVLQEALETIVQETFYAAVIEEKLETIGMPKIEVEKLAPGNDVVYKATVALIPTVKLPDLKKISIKRKEKTVDDKQIADTLEAIRGMHATETSKSGPAEGTDKLVIDMDMYLDKVAVDGGTAKNYQVYLSEEHYIPGFNDQVKGLKKDEEKSFSLDFPAGHYQKMLAGKTVDFKVKVHDVLERQLPELSDDLAKKLGQESLETLKSLVRANLMEEGKKKADQQLEIELFDTLIADSTFDQIPDVLIDAERQKMFYELKQDLDRHGITIDQYLSDIKKKETDLFSDFKAQAEKRAKAALLSRQIAKEQSLSATPEEITAELDMMKQVYKDNEEFMERLNNPEVKDTIATMLQNRKVIEWLKKEVVDGGDKK